MKPRWWQFLKRRRDRAWAHYRRNTRIINSPNGGKPR